MQIGTENGLRLVKLGHANGFKAAFKPDVSVHADKVHEISSKQHELSHDRIIIAL
ncbi:MAG: Uncharacterised protein [Hyphomonas sp. TMED17]|nr:MAG: Uncharacterised protein [Hyphomonas sp. TMED17]